MTDLSDPRAVRERNRSLKLAAKQRQEMIMAVMSMPQGREWVWDILEWCHPFANPFRESPTQTAFLAGEMNIGQRLLAEVQAATPDLYMQMTTEARERDGRRTDSDSEPGNGADANDGPYAYSYTGAAAPTDIGAEAG